MRTNLIAGVAVVAISSLWLTPALASPMAGVNTGGISGYVDVSASYTNLSSDFVGATGGSWAADGAVIVPFANNWAIQGNANYNSLGLSIEDEHLTLSTGSGAGSLMYMNNRGRIGATGSYASESLRIMGSLTLSTTAYGVFGDWYANNAVTLSARGGGLSSTIGEGGDHETFSGGGYAGAQIVGYATPNIAFSGTVDYLSFPIEGTNFQVTNATFGAEGRFWPQYPITIGASYTYADTRIESESLVTSTFGVKLKYYFGPGATLEDQQRGGAESWSTTSPAQTSVFFLP